MISTAPAPLWSKDKGERQTVEDDTRRLSNWMDVEKVPIVGSLSGTIDGVNKTFSFPEEPLGSLLFLNGSFQHPGVQYTLAGLQVTFVTAPPSGSHLIAVYWL